MNNNKIKQIPKMPSPDFFKIDFTKRKGRKTFYVFGWYKLKRIIEKKGKYKE
jgi:hypothetical protein